MSRGTAHVLADLVFGSCMSKMSLCSVVRVVDRADGGANGGGCGSRGILRGRSGCSLSLASSRQIALGPNSEQNELVGALNLRSRQHMTGSKEGTTSGGTGIYWHAAKIFQRRPILMMMKSNFIVA